MPYTDSWNALLRCDDPLARQAVIQPVDLVGRQVILPSREDVRHPIEQWLGEYAAQVTAAVFMNLSVYNKRILVSHKTGIALGLHVATKCPDLRELPLAPAIENGSSLVWKHHEFIPATMCRFISFVQDYLEDYMSEPS